MLPWENAAHTQAFLRMVVSLNFVIIIRMISVRAPTLVTENSISDESVNSCIFYSQVEKNVGVFKWQA
jgi:hypothetical protein